MLGWIPGLINGLFFKVLDSPAYCSDIHSLYFTFAQDQSLQLFFQMLNMWGLQFYQVVMVIFFVAVNSMLKWNWIVSLDIMQKLKRNNKNEWINICVFVLGRIN